MAKFGKHGTAILIMAAIIAVLLMLCTPRSTSKSSAVGATTSLLDSIPTRADPREVRVLVLSFDPIIETEDLPAHQANGLNDPHRLAQEYAPRDRRGVAIRRTVFRLLRIGDGWPGLVRHHRRSVS